MVGDVGMPKVFWYPCFFVHKLNTAFHFKKKQILLFSFFDTNVMQKKQYKASFFL